MDHRSTSANTSSEADVHRILQQLASYGTNSSAGASGLGSISGFSSTFTPASTTSQPALEQGHFPATRPDAQAPPAPRPWPDQAQSQSGYSSHTPALHNPQLQAQISQLIQSHSRPTSQLGHAAQAQHHQHHQHQQHQVNQLSHNPALSFSSAAKNGLTTTTTPTTTTTAHSSVPTNLPPANPPPDPSTITDWPAALRYMTKHVCTNPHFEPAVRKMIREQHKHEQEWWESRKQFLIDQVRRDESSAQIESILRSVGGVVASPMGMTAAQKSAALKSFDLKIHKAASSMHASFALRLGTFNVPFFVLREELIVEEEDKSPADGRKTVTAEQVLGLKRRMVEYLEDLYGGDGDGE